MPGLLSVVATPIGNLEDITLRALRVLREAHLVAAEDTRHTGKLLRHFGIETATISFHAHNVKARLPLFLDRLALGQHLALVTDAGTPGISDPGVELVGACRSAGVRVEALPGPTASITAAVLSGFPVIPLTVLGFPPHRSSARSAWFVEASDIPHTFTFFESPHRMAAAVTEIAEYFVDRPICIARELTKAHETALIVLSNDIKTADIKLKGEFTIVVGPASPPADTAATPDSELAGRFRELSGLLPGSSRRDLVVRLAADLGLSRGAVYSALERAKRVEASEETQT
jgi:16S rRNA (cytidine1402-2'-O)-methyltransferase